MSFEQIQVIFNNNAVIDLDDETPPYNFTNPITIQRNKADLNYTVVEPTCNMYLAHLQLFETYHDFGDDRGNCLGVNQMTNTGNSKQMMMSHLQYYSFYSDILPPPPPILDLITDRTDYFIFNAGGGGDNISPYVDELEEFMAYSAIENVKNKISDVNKIKNIFQCYKIHNDTDSLKKVKTAIHDFFKANYTDGTGATGATGTYPGTGKINLLVDTAGDMNAILASDPSLNEFAYVLTQESAHDPATGNTTPKNPTILHDSYMGNAYVEVFDQGPYPERKYKYNEINRDAADSFESNFTITFKGLFYNKDTDCDVDCYRTKVEYTRDRTNAFAGSTGFTKPITFIQNDNNNPANVDIVSKEVNEIIKTNSPNYYLNGDQKTKFAAIKPFEKKKGDNKATKINKANQKRENANKFYQDFNPNLFSKGYNYDDEKARNLDFCFTKKRAGDGLQAKICQIINTTNTDIEFFKILPKPATPPPSPPPPPPPPHNCDTLHKFKIKRLILVTIDKMLFAYAIRNGIPAILTGNKKLIMLFKPEISPTSSHTGGSSSKKYIPKSLSLSKKYNNVKINSENKNYQVGGSPIEDYFKIIIDNNYILFMLIPHILTCKINGFKADLKADFSKRKDIKICEEIKKTIQNIKHDELTIQYDDDRCILTKLNRHLDVETNSYNEIASPFIGEIPTNQNYMIYFSDKENIYKSDEKEYVGNEEEKKQLSDEKKINIIFNSPPIVVLENEIIGYLNTYIAGYFTRGGVNKFLDKLKSDDDKSLRNQILTCIFGDDYDDSIWGSRGGSGDIKSHDMYIDLVLNNTDFLNRNTLELTNFATILSYLNIFLNNELSLCYNVENYRQQITKTNNLQVTNNIGLYVMFDFLLTDFLEQKSKISYNLLEYFINSGDVSKSKNYLIISCKFMELQNTVYCNDIRLFESLNDKIQKLITNNSIDQNDPIFKNSQTYFAELFGKIYKKQEEIEEYLYTSTKNEDIKIYIKNKLSMYGFMNMTYDFINSLNQITAQEVSPPEVARGVPGEDTTQEVSPTEPKSIIRMLPSQPTSNPPQSTSKTQKPVPFSGRIATIHDYSKQYSEPPKSRSDPRFMSISDLRRERVSKFSQPQYILNSPNTSGNTRGGRYKTRKNNRKTRKNRKISKKNRYIRKTKKNNKNNKNNKTRKY